MASGETADNSNRPSKSVDVPDALPWTTTLTPIRGSPSGLVTVPVSIPAASCATPVVKGITHNQNRTKCRIIEDNFLIIILNLYFTIQSFQQTYEMYISNTYTISLNKVHIFQNNHNRTN